MMAEQNIQHGTKTPEHQYLEVGSLLGRYRILKLLAVGGMAELYLARIEGIEGFEKYVVVKRILAQYASAKRFVSMFLDEARLAASLIHHNIAQVYDIGCADGQYFYAMEYLHGEDLRKLFAAAVRGKTAVPLKHALTIVAGVAAGLNYAHDKRGQGGRSLAIVHRDVSPSNILVTFDGSVKLLDFGIARAALENRVKTRVGDIKGKMAYMSPEQFAGDVDRRSDIFSLGIILWELTVGRRLFRRSRGDTDYQIMQRIVQGDIPDPRTLIPEYPEPLAKILGKALATNRDVRYQTASEFQEAIETFAAQSGIALSVPSLARYIADAVGHRLEPWLEDGDDDDLELETIRWDPKVQGSFGRSYAQLEIVEDAGNTEQDIAPQAPGPAAPSSRDFWKPTAAKAARVPTAEPAPMSFADTSLINAEMAIKLAPKRRRDMGLIGTTTAVGAAVLIGFMVPSFSQGSETVGPEMTRAAARLEAPQPSVVRQEPAVIAEPAPGEDEMVFDEDEAALANEEDTRAELVVITIDAVPSNGALYVDGERQKSNEVTVERSELRHDIKIKTKGFRTYRGSFAADRDRTIVAKLIPRKSQEVEHKRARSSKDKQAVVSKDQTKSRYSEQKQAAVAKEHTKKEKAKQDRASELIRELEW